MTQLNNNLRSSITQTPLHRIYVFVIAIYMMLLPFEYVLTSDFGTINRYIGIAVIGMGLVSGSFRLRFTSSRILIGCFLLYGTISVIWAVSTSYWVEVFLSYLKNAALFFVVAQSKFTRKQNDFIMKSFVAGAVLLAFYLMVSPNAVIDPYSGRTVVSVNEGFFDPNYMAADVIMPIGYMYGFFYDSLTKKKYMRSLFCVAIILLMVYIEILSGSRGGLLAIIGMLFVITVLNMKKKALRRKILFIVPVVAVALIIILQLISDQMLSRFSLESLFGQVDYGGGRIELWSAAWKGIKKNFIFGYGGGCTIPVVGQYIGVNRAAHSLYLSSFVEFGVFASLLYIGIAKEIKKAYRRKLYTEVGIAIGILITSIFLDALSTKFFWAFLIILFTRNSTEVDYGRENI